MLTEGTELQIRQQEGTAVSSARNCFLPSNSLHCRVNAMSRSTVLLEKPAGPQTIKKLPAFRNRIFITAFKTALPSVSIQFIPPHKFSIILPSTTLSSKWSLSLRYPHHNPPWTPVNHTRYMPRLSNYYLFVYSSNIC